MAMRTVKLVAYGDEIIERVLLGVENQHAIICTIEEYLAAQQEGREPQAVGFPLTDVVRPDTDSLPPPAAQTVVCPCCGEPVVKVTTSSGRIRYESVAAGRIVELEAEIAQLRQVYELATEVTDATS